MPQLPRVASHLSSDDAVRLALQHYDLRVTAEPLPGHLDRNFLLREREGGRYVLKIMNVAADPGEINLQQHVLKYLEEHHRALAFQRVQPTVDGQRATWIEDDCGFRYRVWLVSWLPGRVLAAVKPHTPELLSDLGRSLGGLNKTLEGFSHPMATREFFWDLRRASELRTYMDHIEGAERKSLVDQALGLYEKEVVPLLPSLRTSVIHNDANDYNVLVSGSGYDARISGLIDFGDVLHTHTVFEVAIAAAYVMLGKPDPLGVACRLIKGYNEAHPLTAGELAVLYGLIGARLCSSVLVSAYRKTVEPHNDYLTISEAPAWALLDTLSAVHSRFAHYMFREACGMVPCPPSHSVTSWLRKHGEGFAAVTQPDLREAEVNIVDLSVGSLLVGATASAALTEGPKTVIGRWDEPRLCYTADAFAVERGPDSERRSVHLGIDVFQKAGSPVFAPLAGTVAGFEDCRLPQDYGPVLLLEHDAGGTPFWTLYGHLSRISLAGLAVGQTVGAGERIGTLGEPKENGGWPPHLHFQVITDLLGRTSNYPGVVPPSRRAVWRSICPDPNLILGIPASSFPVPEIDASAILKLRIRHVGPGLSLSYRRPLDIVRGYMQYLYDRTGRAYLDAANNVPHVGHSHPRVVRAAARQMAVLNTNTRYLHANLVRYSERLASLLPDPLNVCYFVNSGSAANDLALRLAYAHTGKANLVVLEGAYHGNLLSLIEISPYKFDGPGGSGAPLHVYTAAVPDPYRGAYRSSVGHAGERYAECVRTAIERADGDMAAFISESILGCGGQIEFPEGYLRAAYRHMREAGGVCIADEVQVGFGRVGTHFWGFETQGVRPDIVVMGKPMGNGHPLGAVVTTEEIAASFDTGMEFFSTFGGNPVSCAVGMAVLDVLEDECLQENALRTGVHLKRGLSDLQADHPVVGDVRGRGLFIGVELVRDRKSLEPAAEESAYVADRLCERGILISTAGPLNNVLKIKPSLVFNERDADILVQTLGEILEEDFVRRRDY